jgi:predicted anti-sigma-YlaC factor YlaD
MSRSTHEQARELLALGTADNAADGPHPWLQAHLAECAACRDYQAATRRVVGALRSQPFAADPGLVRDTLARVRSRALELRQRQERNRLVFLSCAFVGLSAAITTPLLWHAFAWTGRWAGVSHWVWQMGFAFLWIAPALGVSAVLLARGTYLAHSGEQPWK